MDLRWASWGIQKSSLLLRVCADRSKSARAAERRRNRALVWLRPSYAGMTLGQRSAEGKRRLCLKPKHGSACNSNISCGRKAVFGEVGASLRSFLTQGSASWLGLRETHLLWHMNWILSTPPVAVSTHIRDSHTRWNRRWQRPTVSLQRQVERVERKVLLLFKGIAIVF